VVIRALSVLALVVLSSLNAGAEERVLAPPSPDQIKVNKLNAEVGKEVVEVPSSLQKKEFKKERPLPPGVFTLFRKETSLPTDAKVVRLSVSSGNNRTQVSGEGKPSPSRPASGVRVETVLLKGYCYLDRTLEIKGLFLPYELACTFDDGRTGIVYGAFVPDFKSYGLVFKPEEVEIDGQRYRVVNGVVMNGDRSSVNLADRVNRKVLEKVALKGFSSATTEGLNAYGEYVEGKYTKTETVGTENPVTVQEKDYPSNYPIVKAFLGLLKGVSDGLKEAFQSELKSVPVVFEVYPKTLYARLEIEVKR